MTHYTGSYWNFDKLKEALNEQKKYSWYYMSILDNRFKCYYNYHGLVLPGNNSGKPIYTTKIKVKNKTCLLKYYPTVLRQVHNYYCHIESSTVNGAIITLGVGDIKERAKFDIVWKGKDINLQVMEKIILGFYVYGL